MKKFIPSVMVLLALYGPVLSRMACAQDAASTQSDNSRARQYISKMAAVYKNLKSYSGAARVSAKVPGQPTMQPVEATVFLQKPNFAAMRFKDGPNTDFAVYDGKNLLVTSSRNKKQYIKQPLSPGLGVMRVLTRAGMTGPGLTMLFNQPDTLEAFLGPSSLSLGEPTKVAGVSVVKVISNKQEGQNKLTATYHIGRDDYLLRQVTLVQTMNGQTVTMTETHTNIKTNPKLPPSTFRFTPPRGAKAVKSFTK